MELEEKAERLGDKIRRLRQAKGLPQDRLAIQARVDQSGLSKFERGHGRHQMGPVPLTRIAQVLGISFAALIEGTDYKGSTPSPAAGQEPRQK
jgi:transcriptional regulator with XRE-family HTH domain